VILRHAKADRPDGVGDFDRPLTARGRADAAAAGEWLTAHGYAPDLALVSPASRARETWAGTGLRAPAEYHQDLYFGGVTEALVLVRAVGEEVGTVVVVGHNPTLSHLSLLLDPAADGLRTAGLAVHRFDGPWQRCGPRRAELAAAHTARAGFSG
jgi:phosphohistidine phosphatase